MDEREDAAPEALDEEDEGSAPVLEGLRAGKVVQQPGGFTGRARTIPEKRRLTRAERKYRQRHPVDDPDLAPLYAGREREWGECRDVDEPLGAAADEKAGTPANPCPWVSCAYHLYLDVDERTGALKINFPGLEVWQMEWTCALREAEASDGGLTLEEVARRTNLTRERIRQLEERVKDRARRTRRRTLGQDHEPIVPAAALLRVTRRP